MRLNSDNTLGDDGLVVGAAHECVNTPSQAIGKIHTATSSVSVLRLSGAVVPPAVGDLLYQGDVIETGADGAVGITFNDGTAFNLSSSASMVLNEFVWDQIGAANSANFSVARGTFGFIAGAVAKTRSLRVDTPVGSIRGREHSAGIGMLSLAALFFSILGEAQAADPD